MYVYVKIVMERGIGMWTLSEQRWVDEVLDNVLDKFPKERWSFIWTGEKATRVRGPSDAGLKLQGETTAEAVTVKDLKKVFRTRVSACSGSGGERGKFTLVQVTKLFFWFDELLDSELLVP